GTAPHSPPGLRRLPRGRRRGRGALRFARGSRTSSPSHSSESCPQALHAPRTRGRHRPQGKDAAKQSASKERKSFGPHLVKGPQALKRLCGERNEAPPCLRWWLKILE